MTKSKQSFRTYIFKHYVAISTSLLVVMGILVLFAMSSIMIRVEEESTIKQIEQSGAYVEAYIDKLKSISLLMTQLPETKAFLKGEDNTVYETIEAVLDTDVAIKRIILVSSDGRIASNEMAIDMTMSDNMMNEPWYVDALMMQGKPIITSTRQQDYGGDMSSWVITMGQEVFDSNGQSLGLLLIDISYNHLEGYLGDLELGQEGLAYIISSNGDLVYYPDIRAFSDENLKVSLLSESQLADGIHQSPMRLITHQTIEGTDWTLLGISSMDGVKTLRVQIMTILLMIGALLMIGSIIAAVVVSDRINKPIQSLVTTMRAVENHLDNQETRFIETDHLNQEYNKMMTHIKDLMAEIKANESQLRAYELKSLQSQINPHFLYNTLDTIVWMAEFEDKAKIVTLTKALAAYFRLALNGGEEWISLYDELSHVDHYLTIQKMRYGDKLTYSITQRQRFSQFKVPKLIIQPIVENAIYHGIKPKEGQGHIKVSVIESEETIQIDISDNGVGFNQENTFPSKQQTKLGGIGLKNVDDRLKLFFGREFGIRIDTEIPEGAKVSVLIPKRKVT